MTDEQARHLCAEVVPDHTGFHFYRCNKEAKWKVERDNGKIVYRCGLHARGFRNRNKEKLP